MADEIPQWACEKAVEAAGFKFCRPPQADDRDGYYHWMGIQGDIAVRRAFDAFARYIQQVDEACREAVDYINGNAPGLGHAIDERLSPFIVGQVDPLLIEARELAAQERERVFSGERTPEEYRSGSADGTPVMSLALAALRRGMELAKAEAQS
jgi:hypothetical protein